MFARTHFIYKIKISRTTELEGWYERNGYLFKPYDTTQWSQFTESDLDADNENEDEIETEKEKEKSKKKKKGPFVGDVRMAIYSLDAREEFVTFVGSIDTKKKEKELTKFRSPISGNEYISLKYGKIDSKECFVDYESENVYTLYFLRGLSLVMSIGMFVSFAHILGWIVSFLPGKLFIPFGHLYGLPFVLYATLFGSVLWIMILAIAWFVPMNEVAFGLLAIILIVFTVLHFISNKKLAKLFELAHKELEKLEQMDKEKKE